MISSKSNETTRRILNFPAIRPCESVSYKTLIASLINLGRSISSFKSKPFFTNKKNSKTSIHLIETLILFLEEAQSIDDSFHLEAASMSSSLSELHVTFQKVSFLLEDCTKDGASLWLLMNSDEVSAHFQALMRSVAAALDDAVLPLKTLNLSGEVEEIAEFVRRQCSKTRFEVETDDKRAVRRVLRVLEQFEHGLSPDCNDLKRVVDYLGITTWDDCNEEIDFLEKELARICEEDELGSVSSLTSYMTYCRCVVFFHDDHATARGSTSPAGKFSGETISCLNPDDFKCPITLEVMKEPVTLSSGHTYDRPSILKWFGSGNETCPKTGERLKSLDFVPNRAVERLISLYFADDHGRIPSVKHSRPRLASSSYSTTVASKQAMALVSNFLVQRLAGKTDGERNKAAFEIRILAKTSNLNRSCLVEANVIPNLLAVLRSNNREIQENAASALLHLSRYSPSKKKLVENGGLEQIVKVLTDGLGVKARQDAAATIFHLSSVGEYRERIGEVQGRIIPGLMGLLYEEPYRAKKSALVTIRRLLITNNSDEIHWGFLSAGLVPASTHLLTSSADDDEHLIADSLSVLAALAGKIDGAMVVVGAGTLDVAVKILCGPSSDDRRTAAKEHCVSLLLALCVNDREDVVVRFLAKNHSLMGSLYSMLVDGSGGSKKRAGSVIRILHEFDEKGSSPPSPGFLRAASDFRSEQTVRAW